MKKILIIGAAGMIGRKLVARLRKENAGELIQQDVVPFADGIVSDLSTDISDEERRQLQEMLEAYERDA